MDIKPWLEGKASADEIRRWHGFSGPKLQIYWITYRGPFTYIRLWNGVLPLDSICLQGENSTYEGVAVSRNVHPIILQALVLGVIHE